MDTLQIHLFGNLKISIILVAANLLDLLQIRKNDQSSVQNFASEIDIKNQNSVPLFLFCNNN